MVQLNIEWGRGSVWDERKTSLSGSLKPGQAQVAVSEAALSWLPNVGGVMTSRYCVSRWRQLAELLSAEEMILLCFPRRHLIANQQWKKYTDPLSKNTNTTVYKC